jgi:curved DNA-binding protein CbpA
MVPDPYRTLDLPHTATPAEIKTRYRLLARRYHPDRVTTASKAEQTAATDRFSMIASAYALLADERTKAQYDHVYRYGGHDVEQPVSGSSRSTAQRRAHSDTVSRKGIGYTCTNPLAYLWTQGKVYSTRTMAGVSLPSRFPMPGSGTQNIHFAFSSGQYYRNGNGERQYVSRTTRFLDGKKVTRVETTTIHADGRRDVTTVDDDRGTTTRHFKSPSQKGSNATCSLQQNQQASVNEHWFVHAWHDFKDKVSMCYNPCTDVAAAE